MGWYVENPYRCSYTDEFSKEVFFMEMFVQDGVSDPRRAYRVGLDCVNASVCSAIKQHIAQFDLVRDIGCCYDDPSRMSIGFYPPLGECWNSCELCGASGLDSVDNEAFSYYRWCLTGSARRSVAATATKA